MRGINACLVCRRNMRGIEGAEEQHSSGRGRDRKIKCGKEKPDCKNCTKTSQECIWFEPNSNRAQSIASGSNRDPYFQDQGFVVGGSSASERRNGHERHPHYSHSPWISDNSSKPVLLDHIRHLESVLSSLQGELESSRQKHSQSFPQLNWNPTSNQSQERQSFEDSMKFPFQLESSPNKIKALLSYLPAEPVIDFLLHEYEDLEKACLQVLTWRLLHSQLSNLRSGTSEVDLSFLALLFSLLSCSIELCDLQKLVESEVASCAADAVNLSDTWLRLSETCLCMSNFMDRPTLNTVTTLTLLLESHSSRGHIVEMTSILSLAIKSSQWLGMDRMGSAKDDQARWAMSSDPPSNSSGDEAVSSELLKGASKDIFLGAYSRHSRLVDEIDRSHLKRESARKLWFRIVAFDYFIASESGMAYQVIRGLTALPQNLDEEDLQDLTDETGTTTLPPEKPPSVATQNCGYKVLQAMQQGCKKASEVKAMSGDSHSTMIQLDQIFRSIFEQIPVFLRLDGVSEKLPEVVAQHEARPGLSLRRLLLYQDLYERLMNVHMPYLSLGHHDPAFRTSTETCVESAKMILHIRKELYRTADGVGAARYWLMKLSVFNALVVLCLHLIELARAGKPLAGESSELREKIVDGIEYLQVRTIRESAGPQRDAGTQIIDGLLRAEAGRRQPAGAVSGAGSDPFFNMVAPNDPLNQYIQALMDPERVSNVAAPDNFFGLLDQLLDRT